MRNGAALLVVVERLVVLPARAEALFLAAEAAALVAIFQQLTL
jgi:hypothetical protein